MPTYICKTGGVDMSEQKLTAKQNKVNRIQHAKKRAFLAAYAETGNISRAAQMAEIDRSTHYIWMREDPAYVEAFAYADQQAGDRLEEEARRRAVEGVEEPVYHQGK